MKRYRAVLLIVLAVMVAAGSPAQTRTSGSKRSGDSGDRDAGGSSDRGSPRDQTPAPAPAPTPDPVSTPTPGPSPAPGPSPGPVEIPHYPVVIEDPVVTPMPFDGPEPSTPVVQQGRVRRIVQVELTDCVEDPPHSGYCLTEEKVVSCDDSTVDMYLAVSPRDGYALIVPEDTDIKDLGPYRAVEDVRTFRPTDWSPNHAVTLTAGNVYVVWTCTDDFFLVSVRDLRENRVIIEWLWHSNLSRTLAAEMEKKLEEKQKREEERRNQPFFSK
jgi:hypothetical protein